MHDLDATAWKHLAHRSERTGMAIDRSSLADRTRSALLDLIDSESIQPGQRLPSTSSLAERFGVSRTVVREALSALSALGILETSNGRSAAVRPLDPSLVRFYLARAISASRDDSFTSLMDVRGPLEVRAARRAAERFRDHEASVHEGRADLLAMRDRLDGALQDSRLYPVLDLELHQLIAVLSGNGALSGLLEAVSVPLFRAMQDVRAAREQRDLVGQEHIEHLRIIDTILDGDPEAASASMRQHMVATESIDLRR